MKVIRDRYLFNDRHGIIIVLIVVDLNLDKVSFRKYLGLSQWIFIVLLWLGEH